jgi:hypothetical protein
MRLFNDEEGKKLSYTIAIPWSKLTSLKKVYTKWAGSQAPGLQLSSIRFLYLLKAFILVKEGILMELKRGTIGYHDTLYNVCGRTIAGGHGN